MRGYLYTALTVLMFITLFTMTYYFHAKTFTMSQVDIGAEKTRALFDDVTDDISSIVQVSASVNNSEKLTYHFKDTFPASINLTEAFTNYTRFINTTYASKVSSTLILNCSRYADGSAPQDFILNPVGYSWGYVNASKEKIYLLNSSGGDGPEKLSLTFDLTGEAIGDLIWLEAEDFSGADDVVSEGGASQDEYLRQVTLASDTFAVPYEVNYTLWVRTVYDRAHRNFTVEVAGKNSTRFDIRNSAPESTYKWFNDTLVAHNLTEGEHTVKIYQGPGSVTECVDAVVLTTSYQVFDNVAPITRPVDPFEEDIELGQDLTLSLKLFFHNVNYSFDADTLSRTGKTHWNLTFEDLDSLTITVGNATWDKTSHSSMAAVIKDTNNNSRTTLDAKITFPQISDKAFVQSGCSLEKDDAHPRKNTLWLAYG